MAEGKGILAADESAGTIAQAVRRGRRGVDRGEPPRLSRAAVHDAGRGGATSAASSSSTRRSASARPTARRSRSCSPRAGIIPGIKVDRGAKPLALAPGRDGHRGARRPARALRGVPRARRAVREVARDVLDRRRASQRVLRLGERPRARPLRRARAGGRAGADRRARGADGRRPLDRRERAGHRSRRSRPCSPSCTTSASTFAGRS